eukprot:306719-Amorphochlora_amoeboformis.AAC.1
MDTKYCPRTVIGHRDQANISVKSDPSCVGVWELRVWVRISKIWVGVRTAIRVKIKVRSASLEPVRPPREGSCEGLTLGFGSDGCCGEWHSQLFVRLQGQRSG